MALNLRTDGKGKCSLLNLKKGVNPKVRNDLKRLVKMNNIHV